MVQNNQLQEVFESNSVHTNEQNEAFLFLTYKTKRLYLCIFNKTSTALPAEDLLFLDQRPKTASDMSCALLVIAQLTVSTVGELGVDFMGHTHMHTKLSFKFLPQTC